MRRVGQRHTRSDSLHVVRFSYPTEIYTFSVGIARLRCGHALNPVCAVTPQKRILTTQNYEPHRDEPCQWVSCVSCPFYSGSVAIIATDRLARSPTRSPRPAGTI